MDTNLGKIGLTFEQIENSKSLVSGKIKGFGAVGDDVIIVTDNVITDAEKATIIQSLKDLPSKKVKTSKEIRIEELKAKPVLTLQELTEIVKGFI